VIHIALVDDHAIFRRGVRALLAEEPDLHLCAEHGSAKDAMRHFETHRCDVVVLDVDMPGQNGFEALNELRDRFPWLRVLLLSFHPEAQYGVRALRLGAAAYVCKADAEHHLVPALRAIAAGRHFVTPVVATQLATRARDGRVNARPHERLSDREFQVLHLLVIGKTNADIAAGLSLSPKTVSTYRTRIMEKLAVASSADLVRYAIEHDLV